MGTQLLGIVTSRDEERANLRRELQKTRDQLSELLLSQLTLPSTMGSRPASHLSLSDCEAPIVTDTSEGLADPYSQTPSGESSYILLPDDGNETLVDKSLDETVEQPAEQPAEQSAEQSPEQPAEQLTDEPAANQEPESIPELDPNTLQPEITEEEQLVDGNNGDEKMELEVSLSSEA